MHKLIIALAITAFSTAARAENGPKTVDQWADPPRTYDPCSNCPKPIHHGIPAFNVTRMVYGAVSIGALKAVSKQLLSSFVRDDLKLGTDVMRDYITAAPQYYGFMMPTPPGFGRAVAKNLIEQYAAEKWGPAWGVAAGEAAQIVDMSASVAEGDYPGALASGVLHDLQRMAEAGYAALQYYQEKNEQHVSEERLRAAASSTVEKLKNAYLHALNDNKHREILLSQIKVIGSSIYTDEQLDTIYKDLIKTARMQYNQ